MDNNVSLPTFSFNTAEAKPLDDALLPEGWYTFKVEEAKAPSRNEKTGKWSQNIKLVVQEGEHTKRIVFHNVALPTPDSYKDETAEKYQNAMQYFLQTMLAFGIQGDVSFHSELLLGRTVRGQVKHDTYDGTTRAKIKKLALHTIDAQTLLD